MDRVTNVQLQTPIPANDFTRQRDFDAIAIGKVMSALLGTGSVVDGLAATAVPSTAVPTLELADGQIYMEGTLDPTQYGSLPIDSWPSNETVMKQGLLLAARGDTNQFQCPAPLTSGDSIYYLVEATYEDYDTDSQTIQLWNASNPSTPNTQTLNRQRWGKCGVVVKAGVASASPSVPAVDAGYVPLFNVLVTYGQTVLNQSNISVYPGAPFITPPVATSLIPQFTDSSSTVNEIQISGTDDILQDGQIISVMVGANTNTGPTTISYNGATGVAVNGMVGALQGGEITGSTRSLFMYDASSSTWTLLKSERGTLQIAPAQSSDQGVNLGQFPSSLVSSGYEKLPNGRVKQWIRVSGLAGNGGSVTGSFPIAFPNACLSITCSQVGTAASTSSGSIAAIAISTSQFTVSNETTGSLTVQIEAIGN